MKCSNCPEKNFALHVPTSWRIHICKPFLPASFISETIYCEKSTGVNTINN